MDKGIDLTRHAHRVQPVADPYTHRRQQDLTQQYAWPEEPAKTSPGICGCVKPVTDTDGNNEKEDGSFFNEFIKPKYFFLWVIIFILLGSTLAVFSLLIKTRLKLKRLENDMEPETRTMPGKQTERVDKPGQNLKNK